MGWSGSRKHGFIINSNSMKSEGLPRFDYSDVQEILMYLCALNLKARQRLVRDSDSGLLAFNARIIPLDQQAHVKHAHHNTQIPRRLIL